METKRLQLKLITREDALFLYELMNTQKWHQFIGDRRIHTPEDAAQYIGDQMSTDIHEKGFVNHLMIEKTTGNTVGTCSLHDRENVDGMDIGYALLPQYEGYGYATEGAEAMVKFAFEVQQQQQVSAITTPQNTGSCRVLEKLGFQYKGLIHLPNIDGEIKLYVLVNPSIKTHY